MVGKSKTPKAYYVKVKSLRGSYMGCMIQGKGNGKSKKSGQETLKPKLYQVSKRQHLVDRFL